MAHSRTRTLKMDVVQERRDGRTCWRCVIHDSGRGMTPEEMAAVVHYVRTRFGGSGSSSP